MTQHAGPSATSATLADMPDALDFAARLKRAMDGRQITVAELHDRAGRAFSERTIFRWRSGDSVPGVEALPILCRALGCTADELLGMDAQED